MCYSGKCLFEQYNGDCKIPLNLGTSGCRDLEETDKEYKDKVDRIKELLEERSKDWDILQ